MGRSYDTQLQAGIQWSFSGDFSVGSCARGPRFLRRYSTSSTRRLRLMAPLCFFDRSRRNFEAAVARVGRRAFGSSRARLSSAENRPMASFLFRSCVRYRPAWRIRMPPAVTRLPPGLIKRAFVGRSRAVDARISKRSCTAVATLLTFCPPGPDACTRSRTTSARLVSKTREVRVEPARAVTDKKAYPPLWMSSWAAPPPSPPRTSGR